MPKNKETNFFEFYPDLWLSDPALSLCTYSTQGIWITMLAYMAKVEGVHYGTLSVNKKALDAEGIRKLIKVDQETFNFAWNELVGNGVLKKSPTGFFYSKRLVQLNKNRKLTNQEKEDRVKKLAEETKEAREEILGYLWSKLGKKLRKTTLNSSANVRLINARLSEGYEIQDFKGVIDVKCNEWLNNEKWEKFLRPATLFAKSHFDDYLNEYFSWIEGKDDRDLVEAVLIYFNRATKKSFKSTPQIIDSVKAVLAAGFSLANIQHVINVKAEEWIGTESEQYLTPNTLFKLDKFQIYLNQKRKGKKKVILNKGKGYGDV